MAHYSNGPYRVVPSEEYSALFSQLAALPLDDIQEFHITILGEGSINEVVSVVSYSEARELVTLSLLDTGVVVVRIQEIDEVLFPENVKQNN